MNKALSRFCYIAVLSLLSVAGAHLHGQEAGALGPFRTQTIELKAGWNAVYLEIEPLQTNPDELFENTPIEIVASYFRPVTSQQFVESPSEVLSDPKGWNVWYRPGRADELLTDLYEIQAHGSYLVYAEEAYTWQVNGTPFYGASKWHPNAYSLVGFPIDPAQAPTVASFFSGVNAHENLKVYQLNSGSWTLVTAPSSTLMEPGVAYWTHSDGDSHFEGPLQVDFNSESVGGLVYNMAATSKRLVLTNTSQFPQALEMSLVAGENGKIPLSYTVLQINGGVDSVTQRVEPFGEVLQIEALEAGQSLILDLGVRQSEVHELLLTTTLIISSDAGVRIEIPVVSIREDLQD